MLIRSGFYLLFLYSISPVLCQDRMLVWSDEFDADSIDYSEWQHETGRSNDNIHYYTSRIGNACLADNTLKIVALQESWMGADYTSALLKTKKSWRYGRMEARIRLPEGNGFVPAFWMLPADGIYGWWPYSGEIDIMEHPTNEIDNIYGTIHCQAYNLFFGSTPPGTVIDVAGAESEFHVYAIEWTEAKIDFFVDDTLYFTYENDLTGSATWPFDKPFYIIFNLAVGGGWVGAPDENTVFPAVMEVDYLRVYQSLDEITINGPDFLTYNNSGVYSVPEIPDAAYTWLTDGNAQIASGQNTPQITVDWNYFGGSVKSIISTAEAFLQIDHPVNVSENVLGNGGFEQGAKYWTKIVGLPGVADFEIQKADTVQGNSILTIDVKTLPANPWEIQLAQRELMMNAGENYLISFRAKSDLNGTLNLAIINALTNNVYYSETVILTSEWMEYEYSYSALTPASVALNIDLGIQPGRYYFDDFVISTAEIAGQNQIRNADFFYDHSAWNLTTLSQAQATDTILNGEMHLRISNAGNDPWDIHVGYPDIKIENGKEYNITFDAYASAPRTISALAGLNQEPWDVYSGENIFSLTAEKQTYSFSFVMNHPTDIQSRIGFDAGGSAEDIVFDNIRINSGSSPVSFTYDYTGIPGRFQLYQNHPNPFNPVTRIKYQLSTNTNVDLSVYNILGQKVATLVSEKQSAGNHSLTFDASNLSSGVYVYALKAGDHISYKKMLLIK